MKQVVIKSGKILVGSFPVPKLEENTVLVEVAYSLISTGTEISSLNAAGETLLRRVLKRPEQIKKALEMMRSQGVEKFVDKIKSQKEILRPMGYSCAGKVIDVGLNVRNFKSGDSVACAGGGYASHAEFVCVPKNLVVKIPEGLGLKEAASVTLGAIALQGVRRAAPQLGEYVVVIGLGLIGQICVQLLKAAGCRVIGFDLEINRVDLAKRLGLDFGISEQDGDPVDGVFRFTDGHGADAAIIAASSISDLPVNQALRMTRKKGKVVCVGDVGLGLNRSDLYAKELDFLISTSYGPGRYDTSYEEQGIDYPIAYVRWTENRNMQEYVRLVAEGKINIPVLIPQEFPVENAAAAFEALKSEEKPLGIFLKYNESVIQIQPRLLSAEKVAGTEPRGIERHKNKVLNVAVIGAGSFALSVHFPNLRKLSNYFKIYAVVDVNQVRAKETADRFGATIAATDYRELLKDGRIDLFIVCTRHNLHAGFVVEALKAGKNVFIEKPLCLDESELTAIISTYQAQSSSQPWLMVGFNRRFSPLIVEIKKIISGRTNPMIVNYRMNAGYIPTDHWVHSTAGGGRNIGEACHIYDMFNFLTDAELDSYSTLAIEPKTGFYVSNDNFVATFKYEDGSLCNLIYTALGNEDVPKEKMEIYMDGRIISFNNYETIEIFCGKEKIRRMKSLGKGHYEELEAVAKSICHSDPAPISFEKIVSATRMSFDVETMIRNGRLGERE